MPLRCVQDDIFCLYGGFHGRLCQKTMEKCKQMCYNTNNYGNKETILCLI